MINRHEAFNKKKAAQVKKAKEDVGRVAKVDAAEVESEAKESEENPQRVDNGMSVDETKINNKEIDNGSIQQTPSSEKKEDVPHTNAIYKAKPKKVSLNYVFNQIITKAQFFHA